MKQLLVFLLLIISWLNNTHAQHISIPDNNFEAKLIALGIDSDGLINGQVASGDVLSVTQLDLVSSNISDLTGIESFPNLTSINCDSNQITTLDASATNLTYLSCANNLLTSIVLPTSGTLRHFYCYDNALTSLDVSGQPNLDFIWAFKNQLSTLDVSNNTVLRDLSCQQNNLTTLNLGNNTNLEMLGCSDNQLTSIDLSIFPNLTDVYVDNNPLNGVLDVSNNPLLSSLFCRGIGLTSLDISNNPALGVLIVSNNQLTSLDISNKPLLNYLDVTDNQLSGVLDLSTYSSFYALKCTQNDPYLRICIPNLNLVTSNWAKDSTAIYTVGCGNNAVQVHPIIDANLNCIADTTEAYLQHQIIKFERQSDGVVSHFSPHGATGNSPFYIDTGVYTISMANPHPYWQICSPSQQLTIDTNLAVQDVFFAVQPIVNCSWLEVDIAAPFLRATGTGSAYTVSYCNTGPATAVNAYVEVELDPDLIYLSATTPLISQVGNLYTFAVGDLPTDTCGSFQVQVLVESTALFAQTHCSQAHIYPDSLCLSSFNLPIVTGEVTCQNDTVYFTLENIGVDMVQSQKYCIFEDNIAMRRSTIQLNSGQSIVIAQAADVAKTYRIEVEQVPNFPAVLGDPIFSLAVEGCNPRPNGSFNTGFITQFSNGFSQPTQAIDCQQNVGSYDPNDKAAQPVGYGTTHFIDTNTTLNYKIRFQNTGTDTAFNIVILDTISPYLDISTLQMGASSHNYSWFIQENVLRVEFANIMLPDSNVNEPLSNGFFRYRIEQQANNPLGTVINNQAAIYFDYNPPIFTNTTFHTIGENFIPIQLVNTQVLEHKIDIKIYPNPFTYSTTLEIQGQSYEQLEVVIYDATGRIMQVITGQGEQLQIERGNLTTGFYFYELKGNGQRIATGKVVVQ